MRIVCFSLAAVAMTQSDRTHWSCCGVQVVELTQSERQQRAMQEQQVLVVFFDATRSEAVVPVSQLLHWDAPQPKHSSQWNSQLATSARMARAALSRSAVFV